MEKNQVMVFIPTYNERENVPLLYEKLKQLPHKLDIVFCDDNSPDGTGNVIDELAAKDGSVHAIHRAGKQGLGTAHVQAFEYARTKGYSYLITMDADFTHDPKYIPAMIAQRNAADIVIGSRYARGGKMREWGAVRLPFTKFWRGMIKRGLGLPYDCMGQFKLYNVAILDPALYSTFRSKGFSINMEVLYHFAKHGKRITEIPIEAHQRIHGETKLSVGIMKETLFQYLRLVFDRLFR